MHHLSLKESAYVMIREKILNGSFPPNCRIREDYLADELSMSRTPVREAINQLAAEGLITIMPRKGIYPVQVNINQINALLDVRLVLEELAVSQCIEQADTDLPEQLRQNLDEFTAMLADNRFLECNILDGLFHRLIAQHTGNPVLLRFLSEIEDQMQIARIIEKSSKPECKNHQTLLEHTQILTCIKTGNRVGAIDAIQNNLNSMKRNMDL